MADKFTAAESIRRLAVQYQDMVAAADALEAIGKIEQTTREAESAQAQAEAARNVALADLQRTKDEAQAVLSDLAERTVAANDQAKGIIADANGQAIGILTDARARADALLLAGQNQASEALTKMSGQLATMQSKLTDLTDQANEALVAKDQAEAAAAEAQQNLANVQAQIRALAGV